MKAEERECDHSSSTWIDDATGWKCYDCGFVIGHLDPAPTNADEMAAVTSAIVKHHEANHAGPWRFCTDATCMPPAFDLMAHANRGAPCACGCERDMHIGEIGCPCGLPDESPCLTLDQMLSDFYHSDDGDYVTARGDLMRHLAALLDRVRREGQAEGLREAAEEWAHSPDRQRGLGVDHWLRDRAARIAGGGE